MRRKMMKKKLWLIMAWTLMLIVTATCFTACGKTEEEIFDLSLSKSDNYTATITSAYSDGYDILNFETILKVDGDKMEVLVNCGWGVDPEDYLLIYVDKIDGQYDYKSIYYSSENDETYIDDWGDTYYDSKTSLSGVYDELCEELLFVNSVFSYSYADMELTNGWYVLNNGLDYYSETYCHDCLESARIKLDGEQIDTYEAYIYTESSQKVTYQFSDIGKTVVSFT